MCRYKVNNFNADMHFKYSLFYTILSNHYLYFLEARQKGML